MKLKLFCLLILTLLVSCESSRTKEVERVSVKPEVVFNDLETRFPGQLHLLGENSLLWTDPFSTEFGVHIFDIKKRQEVGQAVSIGNGPEELISPSISVISKDLFLAYNTHSGKLFFIDNKGKTQKKTSWNKDNLSEINRILPLEQNVFITFTASQNEPFSLVDEEGNLIKKFGKQPFERTIENSYDVYQGMVAYHPKKNVLVYTTFSFPYIAVYGKKDNDFVLKYESLYTEECEFVNNELKFNRSKKGISELALTKDYIVTLERDYSQDPTDESSVGRDFNKAPQTVFLYDYNLNLKKIIHLGMPIFRLTADPLSNEIYAIGINPDFTIIRFKV